MTDISYWLMKSEPNVYGINHLRDEGETLWDGIRNYQARNFMRSMVKGDEAFFYHSNCKTPGIVGLMRVINTCLVDPTQFDPHSKYFDPKSSKEKPKWDCAQMLYLGTSQTSLSLEALRKLYTPEELTLLRKGNRLSITPIKTEIAKDLLQRLGELQ